MKTNATSVATRDERWRRSSNAQGALRWPRPTCRPRRSISTYTDDHRADHRADRAREVTHGNVVGPETGPLTVIVSQDPMYVVFPVSQREFLRVRQEGARKRARTWSSSCASPTAAIYDQDGEIDFVDVNVNRDTDTIMVRAKVPNPQRRADRRTIRPGRRAARQAGREDRHSSGGAARQSERASTSLSSRTARPCSSRSRPAPRSATE